MSSERDSGTPVLEFEKPLIELELRLARLRSLIAADPEIATQVAALEAHAERLRRETFAGLSRWEIVQLARHPRRPSPLDYLERLVPDLLEFHGDRGFADDPAIIGGIGTVGGRPTMVLANARGRSVEEQKVRNFAMSRPEGFRKVVRLARLADRLGLPILTLVDTPSAYPGPDAEERGQAASIAVCLETFSAIRSPVVAVVVGEGGSGGALALSVADRLLMQEYAVFPVISPEACSTILYRDASHAAESADALRPTARDLEALRLVDGIVPEPSGGAHRDLARAAALLEEQVVAAFASLTNVSEHARLEARYARLRSYGSSALVAGSPA